MKPILSLLALLLLASSAQAAIQANPATPEAGQPVTFSDSDIGTSSAVKWNFDDGTGNSTEASPSHTYQYAGVYYVSLRIDNGLPRIKRIEVAIPEEKLVPVSSTSQTSTSTDSSSSTNSTTTAPGNGTQDGGGGGGGGGGFFSNPTYLTAMLLVVVGIAGGAVLGIKKWKENGGGRREKVYDEDEEKPQGEDDDEDNMGESDISEYSTNALPAVDNIKDLIDGDETEDEPEGSHDKPHAPTVPAGKPAAIDPFSMSAKAKPKAPEAVPADPETAQPAEPSPAEEAVAEMDKAPDDLLTDESDDLVDPAELARRAETR